MLKWNIWKKQVIPITDPHPFFLKKKKQGWGDKNPTELTLKVDHFEGGEKRPQSKHQIIHR